MESNTSEQKFVAVDKHRAELLEHLSSVEAQLQEEEVSSQDVLTRIEKVIVGIVIQLSAGHAPSLILVNRSSWANISATGLEMSRRNSVTTVRSDCCSSLTKLAHILKVLSTIYRLVQSNSYATKRDIFYNDTQLFGSQRIVDSIVDDISCMLKLATSKGLMSGALCYQEEDGTRVDCHSSATAVPVSSNVGGIRSIPTLPFRFFHKLRIQRKSLELPREDIVSPAKFVLIVEKDATFQRLLDDDLCSKLFPCIMITGKGVPDVNSRLMVRKLWDSLHIPIFALVDADPHGIEIMCIYKYGSVAMSFEAHSLTVPSVMWLGLLPSDLQRLRVPEEALVPLTQRDESKLSSLLKRPYLTHQPAWQREMELMQQNKVKAEIQSLASIAPGFLSLVYLPNKLRYGGWI